MYNCFVRSVSTIIQLLLKSLNLQNMSQARRNATSAQLVPLTTALALRQPVKAVMLEPMLTERVTQSARLVRSDTLTLIVVRDLMIF